MTDRDANPATGMSARTAATIEFIIIGLCIVALALIFQPFSLLLFSIGCGLVRLYTSADQFVVTLASVL